MGKVHLKLLVVVLLAHAVGVAQIMTATQYRRLACVGQQSTVSFAVILSLRTILCLKSRTMTDARLLNIETTIAYQDDLLNVLNRTVADHVTRIDQLEKQLRYANEQLQHISELLVSMDIADERPTTA